MDQLVIGVDVEQGWCEYTTYLEAGHFFVFPSAAFVVYFHIESSVGQQVLGDY